MNQNAMEQMETKKLGQRSGGRSEVTEENGETVQCVKDKGEQRGPGMN